LYNAYSYRIVKMSVERTSWANNAPILVIVWKSTYLANTTQCKLRNSENKISKSLQSTKHSKTEIMLNHITKSKSNAINSKPFHNLTWQALKSYHMPINWDMNLYLITERRVETFTPIKSKHSFYVFFVILHTSLVFSCSYIADTNSVSHCTYSQILLLNKANNSTDYNAYILLFLVFH